MTGIDTGKFRENGWIFVHDILSAEDILIANKEIKCISNASEYKNTEYSKDYSDSFVSGIDLAKKSRKLRELVDEKMRPLTESLNNNRPTKYVRDQFFKKTNKSRHTPLHQDAYSLPYYCDSVYTLWIPLVHIKSHPLLLLDKSHCQKIPYIRPEKNKELKYKKHSTINLRPGDISIHDGWLIHGTKPNAIESSQQRSAWSIIFADEEELALKKQHVHDEKVESIDSDFLRVVERTRNEIKNSIY